MSDNNFIRFFVMLNEVKSGYGAQGSPNGYCKVESVDGKSVFTFSMRNVKQYGDEYSMYVTFKSADTPALACKAIPGSDGTIYKSAEADAKNVFSSGKSINEVEAMYVVDNANNTVMSGYMNRNLTRQAKQLIDNKLNNIEIKKEQPFEAASTNMGELEFCDTLPDEIEAPATPLEVENNEPEKPKKEENNISAYVQTIQKLYEGIVGAKKSTQNSAESSGKTDYFGLVGDFYDALVREKAEATFPFSTNNTKWVKMNDESDYCHTILGLVYEDGKVKYIANGVASRCTDVAPVGSAVWFPILNGKNGINGYWVQFVDAESGKATVPDFKIL